MYTFNDIVTYHYKPNLVENVKKISSHISRVSKERHTRNEQQTGRCPKKKKKSQKQLSSNRTAEIFICHSFWLQKLRDQIRCCYYFFSSPRTISLDTMADVVLYIELSTVSIYFWNWYYTHSPRFLHKRLEKYPKKKVKWKKCISTQRHVIKLTIAEGTNSIGRKVVII